MQNVAGFNQDQGYSVPSTQIVIIKGQSCIEPISLPHLQSYFTNIQLLGREYAYFKISHFDFPLNDSLVKIFGTDTLSLTFTVQQYVNSEGNINNADYDHMYESQNQIEISLLGMHSTADLANALINAIAPLMNNDDNYRWLNWVSGISYEEGPQKLGLTLTTPDIYLGYNNDNNYYIKRLIVVFSGNEKGRAGALAAAIFGGKVYPEGWACEFDTGRTKWFYNQAKWIGNASMEPLTQLGSNLQLLSNNPTRMFIDPYVYIRGAPEHSVWNPNGTTTDIMTVQPRNRPPGVITNTQAFLNDQTHSTRTSLQALRSMTLFLTDSQGTPLTLDDDYVLKISIEFVR